jgi:tetratricopeptide (TPR) repeat protein
MQSVVRKLGDRLVAAEADRPGALLDLAARHLERGKPVSAVTVALDAAAASEGNPARRSQAYCLGARALMAIEANDNARDLAARAIVEAVQAGDAMLEARAREVQASLLMRRGHFPLARHEYRMAGLRHRLSGSVVEMKRMAMGIANSYRQQGIVAGAGGRHAHANANLKQALRAYRAALATGESPNEDAEIAAGAADCECRLGNYGLARIHIERAEGLLPRVDDQAVVAEVHLAMCRLHRVQGELKQAEWAGERACNAAHSAGDEVLARGLLALATVHDSQGRFERASDIESRGHDVLLSHHRALERMRAELGTLPLHATFAPQVRDIA